MLTHAGKLTVRIDSLQQRPIKGMDIQENEIMKKNSK